MPGAVLGERLEFVVVEHVLIGQAPGLHEQGTQLVRDRHIPVGGIGFQVAILGGAAGVVDVPLHMHQVFLPVEVAPFEPQRLASAQTEIIEGREE